MFGQSPSVGGLVEALRVEGPTKPQQAEVTLEVRRDCGSSQVEPARTARRARNFAHSGARSSCRDGVRRVQQRLRLRDRRRVRHCKSWPQHERRKQLYTGCPSRRRAACVQVPVHGRCKRAQRLGVDLIGGCTAAVVLWHGFEERRRLWHASRRNLAKLRRKVKLVRSQLGAEHAAQSRSQICESVPNKLTAGPDCSAVIRASRVLCRVKKPQLVRLLGVLCDKKALHQCAVRQNESASASDARTLMAAANLTPTRVTPRKRGACPARAAQREAQQRLPVEAHRLLRWRRRRRRQPRRRTTRC